MSHWQRFKATILPALFLITCVAGAWGDDAAKKRERAQSHLIEARRLAADYKIDKAAEKARDALKDNPSLAEAHVYLGLEHLRASDLKNAEVEFDQSLKLDPYLAAAHCGMGYVLYQQGQLESATDHWMLSARLDPSLPQALAGVALSQFKHGQEEEAVRTYQKVLTYDRRFTDSKFLESDHGPKWSGRLLDDFVLLLAKVPRAGYP